MKQRMKVSLLLLSCLAIIFVYLLARIWSNIPSVFPDEYIHAKFARYTDFQNIQIPSYLYYAVYWLTLFFDDQFLNAARVLNTVFYLAGCFMIYTVARQFLSDLFAFYVAIIAALSPMNTYVNYFMAESMFFFFFWLFLASAFFEPWRKTVKGNAIIGLFFGGLLLVKPHALFIMPVYPLALILVFGLSNQIAKLSLSYIAVAIIAKFSAGFLVAGHDGLTLFGSIYSGHANDVYSGILDIPYAIRSVLVNLLGNVFAMVSVFGLSMIYLFVITPKSEEINAIRFMKWLIILIVVTMVPFVSVFSTSVALFDDNINYRIYMRYYNYMFPLIFIYALTHWGKSQQSISKTDRLGLVSILAAPIIYIAYHYSTTLRMLPYKVLGTDTPEFFLLSYDALLFYSALAISLIILFLWVLKPKHAMTGFFYIYIPLFLIVTNINNLKSIHGRNIPTNADQAGRTASSVIPETEHDNVLVIGTHDLELTRFLLYLNSGTSTFMEINVNDSIDTGSLDSNIRWIAVIGEVELRGKATIVQQADNYVIYKRD